MNGPKKFISLLLGASILVPVPAVAVAPPEYKQEAIANVDSHTKMVQVMVGHTPVTPSAIWDLAISLRILGMLRPRLSRSRR